MLEKQELYNGCQSFVDRRLQTVESIILSNQKALQSETKSSAGDKHETGRAMLQLEMEKAGQQLSGITQMKEVLAKINLENKSTIAHLGSVVITDKVNYFIAISAGKLTACGKDYFAVSPISPIGKVLLGKQKGAIIKYNNLQIEIKNVV